MDYGSRQKKFQQTLGGQNLDGFLVTHPANLRYLCGYTGSNGLLLFLAGRLTFFTDGRYSEQARQQVGGARVVISKGPLLTDAAKIIGKLTSAAIGFEADYTTVASAELLRKLVPRRIHWKPTAGLIMRQRMIKDPEELSIIRSAVQMGAAFDREFGSRKSRESWNMPRDRRELMACRSRPSSRPGNGRLCLTDVPPAKPYPGVDSW
jgi:Xaa-Pro aminopeptidase